MIGSSRFSTRVCTQFSRSLSSPSSSCLSTLAAGNRSPCSLEGRNWQCGQTGPAESSDSTSAAQLFSLSSRSEEHTSEFQSLMRISYAVFCLKKKTTVELSKNKYQQLITQLT